MLGGRKLLGAGTRGRTTIYKKPVCVVPKMTAPGRKSSESGCRRDLFGQSGTAHHADPARRRVYLDAVTVSDRAHDIRYSDDCRNAEFP